MKKSMLLPCMLFACMGALMAFGGSGNISGKTRPVTMYEKDSFPRDSFPCDTFPPDSCPDTFYLRTPVIAAVISAELQTPVFESIPATH
ncbi:hypothetical protein [Chitinophaga deserti]|uniref:hypothetical protein n=1 Tax=Chitinophaga deserti TaxID=2164099 RepID=UPI000D6D9A4E|nr:hypothetical protein [Chitinophaga deserti]